MMTQVTHDSIDNTRNESHVVDSNSSNNAILQVDLYVAQASCSTIITDLPVELLIKIFIHALPIGKHAVVSRCIAPLQLTHVCSRWRKIAKETTRLWTSIALLGPSPSYTRSIKIPLHRWLTRAKQRPLSLSFKMMDHSQRSGTAYLMDSLPRVRVLSLSMFRHQYEPLFSLPMGSMPLLESLKLSMRDRPNRRGPPFRQGSIEFGGCIALRKVVLHSTCLIRLTVHEPSLHPYTALRHIVQCMNIEECTLVLGAYREYEAAFGDFPPVVLSHLCTLDITFNGQGAAGGMISPFLKPLTMPSLVALQITAKGLSRDPDLSSILVELQTRSLFSLRTLTLLNISVARAPLRAFLRDMPTLRSLQLQSAPGSNHKYHAFLEWLRYDPVRAQQLLPNLVSIFISDNVENNCSREDGHARFIPFSLSDQLDDHTVVRGVATRFWTDENGGAQPGLAKLERVTVEWRNVPVEWCQQSRDAMFGVEHLNEAGLDMCMPLEECRSRYFTRSSWLE